MTVPVKALYYQFLVPADSIPEAESPAIPLDPFNEFQSMTTLLNSIQSSVSFVTVSPTSPMVKTARGLGRPKERLSSCGSGLSADGRLLCSSGLLLLEEWPKTLPFCQNEITV